MSQPSTLAGGLIGGDRRALARALTAVEEEIEAGNVVLRELYPRLGRAHVVGITGAPGAGKSTLVNAYVRVLRQQGKQIGILAVDPSSPRTGGAILGDRTRMREHTADAGVFVRSVASRGHPGGLSRVTSRLIDVMDGAGMDVVIVETVGAGQSEVEIADLAHTKIVVTVPGLGDEVQALKAGILEIADIFVVNKADCTDARRTASHLEEVAHSAAPGAWRTPVILTTATSGEGVAELGDAVQRHGVAIGAPKSADPRRRIRWLIASSAGRLIERRVRESDDARLDVLLDAVGRGELDFAAAACRAANLVSTTCGQSQ